MTEDQEKALHDKIDEGFKRAIDNTVIIDKRVKSVQMDNTEHIHRNVLDMYQWMQTLMKDVDKLRRQVAALEEKVSR